MSGKVPSGNSCLTLGKKGSGIGLQGIIIRVTYEKGNWQRIECRGEGSGNTGSRISDHEALVSILPFGQICSLFYRP